MSDDKLRVPGPDDQKDLTRLDESIFYSLMIGLMLCGAVFLYTRIWKPPADE